MSIFLYLSVFIFLAFLILYILIRSRNMQYWIGSYIKSLFLNKKKAKIKHVYFSFVDHYEPYYQQVTESVARGLVDDWVNAYPNIANKHKDSDGNVPQHTYFYPIEEYDKYVLDKISELCNSGYGDVDIHLHHDDDTAENLTKELIDFKNLLYNEHNLLRKNKAGEIVYGFIHGNWALDNSRPDGRWCGIDNELDILINTGCVFDMTLPSAPSDTQTKIINSIYYAKEDGHAKSHDKGRNLESNITKQEVSELLMIQGPLTLNWKNRKFGLIPKIESGELSGDSPPSETRIKLWEECGISIKGEEEHIFIKVHTHGLQKPNMNMLFDNNGFDLMWTTLENNYRDTNDCELHYLTAWEMYEKIKHLENTH
ncbi:MAG: hypothetical protein DIZ80_06450 [endosymbiont of Galathealinum brachiosum]|uniref:Uncharacterized protein n=1 Tax=endosymbiont of Galathealinum brachiosum TaxID=2200906 RepID=A0A370DHD6_9GAMM|nr:MAG: hypothetical protein DIZ80_06450 [endosymbiont of Galathealinum brachiosum]